MQKFVDVRNVHAIPRISHHLQVLSETDKCLLMLTMRLNSSTVVKAGCGRNRQGLATPGAPLVWTACVLASEYVHVGGWVPCCLINSAS